MHAAGQKVDAYMARVLDPPFVGKQWEHKFGLAPTTLSIFINTLVKKFGNSSAKIEIYRESSEQNFP